MTNTIINPKYKKAKGERDWLAALISEHASKTRVVSKTTVNPDTKEKTVTEETRDDGIDIDKLYSLLGENGVHGDKLAKFVGKEDAHGFAGRFRMSARNMLQAVAKQRHGLNVDGMWVDAPSNWLEHVKAPAQPTHQKDGTKVAVVKEVEAKAA